MIEASPPPGATGGSVKPGGADAHGDLGAAVDATPAARNRSPLLGIVRTMRPHQWVKNGFVLVPVLFARELGDPKAAARALFATMLFCLASSAVYVLNDLLDVDADRRHPLKRHRPIASGLVSTRVAWALAGVLTALALVGASQLEARFLLVEAGYLTLNVAYSLRLKHVPYVDVLSIAAGFEFRVLGGSYAAGVPPSAYLLAVTGVLALFLGFGKRMHETLQGEQAKSQRRVLGAYNPSVLRLLLFATAIGTVTTYVVYTLDPHTIVAFGTPHLVWTAPMPAFGVFRFLQLVEAPKKAPHGESESPTEAMLKDWPFIANLLMWAGGIVGILYVG